jgi:triacylglycerol lipase
MKKQLLKCLGATLIAAAVLPATSFAVGHTETKYPIMLVHGLLGFDNIGPVEYFYGIPGDLRAGGAKVIVSQVSAANSTEERGKQLALQVKAALATYKVAKINLIGHSHGGPTMRYVAHYYPELIASVTSVNGVNKGTVIADVLVGVAPSSVVNVIGSGLTTLINVFSGGKGLPSNASAAARSLSTAGSLAFNKVAPEGVPTSACGEGAYSVTRSFNGGRVGTTHYFSWGGASSVTNVLDVSDAAFGLLGLAFFGAKNDGVVPTCSMHLGKVLRSDYKMNHADSINQLVGIVHLFETNPKEVYRTHANRLRNMGL